MTAVLPVSTQRFSTEAFAPSERVAVWRDLYGKTIARLDIDPLNDDPLMAEASLRSLPGLGLVSMASTALRFQKPKSLINNDDLILMIVDSGHWTGSQLGREANLGAGDAVLCSNADVATGTTFGRRVMFRLPARSLASMLPDASAMVLRRIPRETDGLLLLRQYIQVIHDSVSLAEPALQRMTVAHVRDLVAVTLGATRDAAAVAKDHGVRAARLRGIKDDIAASLQHGDVSIAAIATRHRVTPRTVQKMFEQDGTTFSEYVLAQRLAQAHRLLSDPRLAMEKIAAVAFMAGFGDVSRFYRAFRSRYGALPTDVRAQARRDH